MNGGIFWGFSLADFYHHELLATFAKIDDFIMKHSDSMHQQAVYCKSLVFTETIFFLKALNLDGLNICSCC
jgi:hypothetical protein